MKLSDESSDSGGTSDEHRPDFTDLDDKTVGRIDGLLEAVDVLMEKRDDHEDWQNGDEDTHHIACKNTCHNMAKDLQVQAIETAMEAVSNE